MKITKQKKWEIVMKFLLANPNLSKFEIMAGLVHSYPTEFNFSGKGGSYKLDQTMNVISGKANKFKGFKDYDSVSTIINNIYKIGRDQKWYKAHITTMIGQKRSIEEEYSAMQSQPPTINVDLKSFKITINYALTQSNDLKNEYNNMIQNKNNVSLNQTLIQPIIKQNKQSKMHTDLITKFEADVIALYEKNHKVTDKDLIKISGGRQNLKTILIERSKVDAIIYGAITESL